MIKKFNKRKQEKAPELSLSQMELNEDKVFTFKGKKGDKGDQGDLPTVKDLVELILQHIPDPVPGEKGKPGETYVLTQKDKKEIAGMIKVPIVEKIIEKPIIKEIALPIPPEELRDKLEGLDKKLSIQAIEELPKILEELSKRLSGNTKESLGLLKGSIHGRSKEIRFVDDETPAGDIDGANTAFTLKRTPIYGSVKLYRNGSRQRVTDDYTILGKEITVLVAPQVGEILLADYRY